MSASDFMPPFVAPTLRSTRRAPRARAPPTAVAVNKKLVRQMTELDKAIAHLEAVNEKVHMANQRLLAAEVGRSRARRRRPAM